MVSIVIPLFNEQDNVAPLTEEIRAAMTGLDYEIIFVDDKSSDGTLEAIPKGDDIRVIKFVKNKGFSQIQR